MKKNSTLNLLLKNSFRNTVNAFPVVLGLTLLITLLSLIISLMTSIANRVVDNYNALKIASNSRDALVEMAPTELVPKPDDDSVTNSVENQQHYIYKLQKQYANSTNGDKKYDFYWTRTEGRNFTAVVNTVSDDQTNELKIKIVGKNTPTSEQNVDALAVKEGRNIKFSETNPADDNIHDTVMDATFAKANDIKIGDIIRVQPDSLGTQLKVDSKYNDDGKHPAFAQNYADIKKVREEGLADPNGTFEKQFSTYQWLEVVGFGESYDYTFPMIDQQTTIPNKHKEMITYVNPHIMGLRATSKSNLLVSAGPTGNTLHAPSDNDTESYYSLRFKDRSFTPTKADIDKINKDLVTDMYGSSQNRPNRQYVFLNGDKNYAYAIRTTGIESTLKIYNLISGVVLAVVAIIVIFSVALISKKQIDKTRSQIGVMKALGYEKKQIVWNYVTMPFISSLVGGMLGFIIAQVIQNPLINLFVSYFNLDISGWAFDVGGFMIDIIVMWFVVTGVGFLIAYWVMRTDTLELLTAAKASHISKFGMMIKESNKTKGINSQMETALFASNSGKMTSVTLIVLAATIVMTAAFPLPTILKNNQTQSYTGIKYNQIIDYNEPAYNNPYTFLGTWDPSVQRTDQIYQYSKTLQKVTSSKLGEETTGYDYDSILRSLETGKIDSEYYDLEFGANGYNDPRMIDASKSFDGNGIPVTSISNPNVVKEGETPNAMQTLIANLKMLEMYKVTLNTSYFKTISNWEIKDPFGWNVLSNEWPAYITFVQTMQKIGKDKDSKDVQAWMDTYDELQSFYKQLIASVGLTVTRDYWMTDANSNKTIDGMTPYDAYAGTNTNDSQKRKDILDTQINFFNEKDNEEGRKKAFESFLDESNGSGPAFGNLIKSAAGTKRDSKDQKDEENKNILSVSDDFRLSDSKSTLGEANHIYTDINKNQYRDHYMTDTAEQVFKEFGLEGLQKRISDYLTWYGCYVSERSGTAFVLASYSRPPYFVQQYTKNAYENGGNYRYGFGTVPYDPEIEQLGIEMNGETNDTNNKKLSFKIYGIQNNNKYLDLTSSDGTDLISKLFDPDYEGIKYDEPGIVVNESLAKKLNIKAGDDVNWNILYKELQEQGTAVTLNTTGDDGWKIRPRQRTTLNNGGWISQNDMDTFDISVNGTNFATSKTNLTNSASDFYKKYVKNEFQTATENKDQVFKVIGVHKGYGTPSAWVRNDQAEKIMNFDKSKAFLWDEMFRAQFGNIFDSNKNQIKNDYMLDENSGAFITDGTEDHDKGILPKGSLVTYDKFVALLNGTLGNWDESQKAIGRRIMAIFENAYPVFNYKYSMSNNPHGDFDLTIATWDETGGYSPIEENGGEDLITHEVYNPVGVAGLKTIMPIQTSKDVLNQLSLVILSVIIIVIVLIIILTFIIIMLTTSLIISDNIRFIATMKVLGYTDGKIVNTVLGMYAIAIVCAYVVGFIAGWFILQGSVNAMAMTSSFVLPLVFPWWLLFAVALAVCGIYIITFAIGFAKIQKANPLDALKNMEI